MIRLTSKLVLLAALLCACSDPAAPRAAWIQTTSFTTIPAAAAVVSVIDLGTLPGHVKSVANGVNRAGVVSGNSAATPGGVFQEQAVIAAVAGGMVPLGVAAPSSAYDLNEHSHAAGAVIDAANVRQAFIWTPATGHQLLPPPPNGSAVAHGLNDLDQVVGRGTLLNGETHALMWNNSSLVDLGTLGGTFAWANEINNIGQVVGFSATAAGEGHAFVWSAVTGMRDLGAPVGGHSFARGINELGQVSGTITVGTSFQPVVWEPDGTPRFLPVPAGSRGDAHGINNRGDVVGQQFDPLTGVSRGIVWTAEGEVIDLGVAAGAAQSGGSRITDTGLVAGVAGVGSTTWRATLWILQLPDPTAASAMASLSATIANYVANGILSPQQAQALNAQLRAAAAAIAADRPGAAGILQGFSRHVQALVGSGMLQLIHAQVLLDTAAAAVAQL